MERTVAAYESGYSGFWLARVLRRAGVEVHVIQPVSVPVDRRACRAKTDAIDVDLLLRTCLAFLRGEPRVCSMVPVPEEADEDARHPGRKREQGITRAGNRRLRTAAVELAWLWIRYQPGSGLAAWFRQRLGDAGGRMRKVLVVVLARKLLIALWRFATQGLVPQGASTRTA